MLTNIPETEYLERFRQSLEIPKSEARVRLMRDLELSRKQPSAPRPKRRPQLRWVSALRLRLGGGLTAAGVWLAGRGGDVL